MIDLKNITQKDIGKWVIYHDSFDKKAEQGRIKSYNNRFIFVVYACSGEWDRYQAYTGVATRPEDLEFKYKKGVR